MKIMMCVSVNSYYNIKRQSGSQHASTEDSRLYQNCLSAMRENYINNKTMS